MSSSSPSESQDVMRIRRAPKAAPFVLLGISLGVVVSLIVTGLFPSDPSVGFAVLAGYFSLWGATAGLVVGLGVWLTLDLVSRKRAKDVRISREKGSDA